MQIQNPRRNNQKLTKVSRNTGSWDAERSFRDEDGVDFDIVKKA